MLLALLLLFFLSFCRYKNLQKTYPWYANITRRRLEVLGRAKIEPDFDKATEYFYAMLGYLDALQIIQYEIRSVPEEELSDPSPNVLFCYIFSYRHAYL